VLQSDIEELSRRSEPVPRADSEDPEARRKEEAELEAWRRSTGELLVRMQARLRDTRRVTGVGASS
jgi:hypothetical protein